MDYYRVALIRLPVRLLLKTIKQARLFHVPEMYILSGISPHCYEIQYFPFDSWRIPALLGRRSRIPRSHL